MDTELEVDNVFIQIRDKLQKDGVKLWLEPYYVASKPSLDDLVRLAEDYSKVLNLPQDACYNTLLELQEYSLDKLKQRKLFEESGIATLKIKMLLQNSPQTINKEVLLSSLVSELKNDIGAHLETPVERLKLISNGKVLHDKDNLFSQGVKNGNHILVVILSESVSDLMKTESRIKEAERIKADTQLLASDTGSHYMELEDQAGNAVKIPKNERKALMIAMALHEKGRSALKIEDYPSALTFFLDADSEFSQCNAQLLEMVDNYALLDLDIAWCYLCLQSVNQLPEAYKRLKRCESTFEKSYGPNLERVIALKGTPGNEAVLFLRLHLLQAVVLFHQNKRGEALNLFKKVDFELQKLKVDENSLLSLVELGFTPAEARLGLRATHGDVNLAANYINENREKRAESRKKALADKIFENEQKKLGKCDNGKEYVNPNFLTMLVNMGFNKEVARIALQKCNNIISDSIQHIQDNPGASSTRSQEVLSLIEDLIPELQSAGFDYNRSKMALEKYNGDILQAANYLLTQGPSEDDDNSSTSSTSTVSENQKEKTKPKKNVEEEKKKKEEAFMRLSKDITMVDDDHLDFTLNQEELFLRQYMSLLQD